MPRGGPRQGAGRKPAPIHTKQVNIRMTSKEEMLVRAYLAKIRKDGKVC